MTNHGDWQLSIYIDGLSGVTPTLPMSHADLARLAEQKLSPQLWSYVAGGAGDERTQNANCAAFGGWGLMPRMLRGTAQRDLTGPLEVGLTGLH